MTVIEYLSRPQKLRKQIARKLVRVESLRWFASRLTPTVREVEVKSTPDPARMQAFLSEAADEEQAVLRMRKELDRVLDETALYISYIPDSRIVRVMELRYLEGLDWQEIALEMDYFISSVYRVHRKALAMLPPPPEVPEGSLV